MPRAKPQTVDLVRIEPIAVERSTAAAMLSLGVSTFEAHVARGTLPRPRQMGGRVAWLVDELRAAAHALPVIELPPPPTPQPGG
jgi:predicted DNA-binding transcriptional regulator AlpA